MFSHINQYGAINSIRALDNVIKGQDLSLAPSTVPIRQHNSRKPIRPNIDYSNQKDVLFVIQNYDKFLKIIRLIAKPNKPSLYIYTELNYLVLIISSNLYYPIIICKFPVKQPYVYIQDNLDICISFPDATIVPFMTNSDKSSCNYTILLRKNKYLTLEYIDSTNTINKSTDGFLEINRGKLYDVLFTDKLISLDIDEQRLFEPDISSTPDYLQRLQQMPIDIILKARYIDNLSFPSKNLTNNHYLVITKNEITWNVMNKNNNMTVKFYDHKIDSKSFTNPLIYWNEDRISDKKLNVIKYINIFKNSENVVANDESVYYCLAEWCKYGETQTWMIMKIITPNHIEAQVKLSQTSDLYFASLFNNGVSLIEFSLCY